METIRMYRRQIKLGFIYTIKCGDKIIDERVTDREYLAVTVCYLPTVPPQFARPLYHGKIEKAGKTSDVKYYIERGYKFKTAILEQ